MSKKKKQQKQETKSYSFIPGITSLVTILITAIYYHINVKSSIDMLSFNEDLSFGLALSYIFLIILAILWAFLVVGLTEEACEGSLEGSIGFAICSVGFSVVAFYLMLLPACILGSALALLLYIFFGILTLGMIWQ